MVQSQPAKRLRVFVPRHKAHPLQGKLLEAVEALAKERRIRLRDLPRPTKESQTEIAQAIESASDWNSLLATARAQRGPQFDVGTQQFLVDKESTLYYDPTPLFADLPKRPQVNLREQELRERDIALREREMLMRQQRERGEGTPQRQHPQHINTHGMPPNYNNYGMNQNSSRGRPFPPGPGNPGSPFYGGPGMGSPGGMGFGGSGTSPVADYQNQQARNMSMGMPPQGMRPHMSNPDVRRSARVRGMDDMSMGSGGYNMPR